MNKKMIEKTGNYINIIDSRTEYTDAEVLNIAEKEYGTRPTSCKFGWIHQIGRAHV